MRQSSGLVFGIALVGACGAWASAADELPAAMREARLARSEAVLRTGQIEFVVTDFRAGAPRVRVMTWYFAGPDYILVDRGDEHGIVLRDQAGEPSATDYNTPQHFLVRDRRVWTHHERSPQARVATLEKTPKFEDLLDPRQVGLTPFRDATTIEERVAESGRRIRWDSRLDGELERVTADFGDGAIVWLLDPGRAWNPVQIQTIQDGKVVGQTEIDCRQVDGVWFPRRLEAFGIDDGHRRPLYKFDFVHVAINRPGQPARLTPADIGIEVGTNLDDLTGATPVMLLWDGTRGVPSAEYHRRVQAGELQPGPTLARETARLAILNERRGDRAAYERQMAERGRLIELTPRSLGQWERYTLQFIDDYSLDDAQRERAMTILKDCMDEGSSYISRKRADFDDFDQRLMEAQKSPDRTEARWNALRDERERLVGPLDRIFAERLKPRLHELLTTGQQQRGPSAGEGRPTTQPRGAG